MKSGGGGVTQHQVRQWSLLFHAATHTDTNKHKSFPEIVHTTHSSFSLQGPKVVTKQKVNISRHFLVSLYIHLPSGPHGSHSWPSGSSFLCGIRRVWAGEGDSGRLELCWVMLLGLKAELLRTAPWQCQCSSKQVAFVLWFSREEVCSQRLFDQLDKVIDVKSCKWQRSEPISAGRFQRSLYLTPPLLMCFIQDLNLVSAAVLIYLVRWCRMALKCTKILR